MIISRQSMGLEAMSIATRSVACRQCCPMLAVVSMDESEVKVSCKRARGCQVIPIKGHALSITLHVFLYQYRNPQDLRILSWIALGGVLCH